MKTRLKRHVVENSVKDERMNEQQKQTSKMRFVFWIWD